MAHLFDQITSVQKFLSVRPLGLISDIDGTISSTAPTPAQAQVSPLRCHYPSLLVRDLELVVAKKWLRVLLQAHARLSVPARGEEGPCLSGLISSVKSS